MTLLSQQLLIQSPTHNHVALEMHEQCSNIIWSSCQGDLNLQTLGHTQTQCVLCLRISPPAAAVFMGVISCVILNHCWQLTVLYTFKNSSHDLCIYSLVKIYDLRKLFEVRGIRKGYTGATQYVYFSCHGHINLQHYCFCNYHITNKIYQ